MKRQLLLTRLGASVQSEESLEELPQVRVRPTERQLNECDLGLLENLT